MAKLAVVHTLPTQQRPPAPDHLSAEEQAEWRALVGTMPATWFPRECHAALAALCRHTCRARVLGERLNTIQAKCLGTEEGLRALDLLLKMMERETRCIASLSRTMRLTQQTRIDKRVAGSRAAGVHASAYDDGRLDAFLGDDDDRRRSIATLHRHGARRT